MNGLSVIIPAYNEEDSIIGTLSALRKALNGSFDYELIVVNDGSTDSTRARLDQEAGEGVKVINHVENLGYGKSLLDGINAAGHDCIAIIDADSSYPADSLKELYAHYPEYDMVVGARQGKEYEKGVFKKPARMLFKYLAEYASGRKIADVNSGLRIFKKDIVMRFKDSLCTGFSFTTTITLIFLLNHYYVKYVPIEYMPRKGKSKVRHFQDTLRAGQIIVTAILYYNPVKLFLLFASCNLAIGVVLGILNYLFFKAYFISMASGLCLASFIPLWSLGFIAEQLKRIYNLNKQRNGG